MIILTKYSQKRGKKEEMSQGSRVRKEERKKERKKRKKRIDNWSKLRISSGTAGYPSFKIFFSFNLRYSEWEG